MAKILRDVTGFLLFVLALLSMLATIVAVDVVQLPASEKSDSVRIVFNSDKVKNYIAFKQDQGRELHHKKVK